MRNNLSLNHQNQRINNLVKSECDYSIRFIEISSETVELLKKYFSGMEFTLRKSRRDSEKLVFTAPINHQTSRVVREIINLIEAKKIDIFISVLQELDSEILEIPQYVSSLLGLEPIELTLSYTFVG